MVMIMAKTLKIILGLALQTFLSVDAGHLSPDLLRATQENFQRYEQLPLS
jgi:hypothetical protein